MHRLEKQQIVEDVLPLLWIVNQTDPEVIARTAGILESILKCLRDSRRRRLCVPSKTIVLNTYIPTTHVQNADQGGNTFGIFFIFEKNHESISH